MFFFVAASFGTGKSSERHLIGTIGKLLIWKTKIARESNIHAYTDQALAPVVGDDDEQVLDLFTKTTGAKAAIDHVKKVAALTH